MYRRNLTGALLAALADSPVVFLQGARQTGKSTLVQQLANEDHPARYLTLDDPTILAAAQADPVGFLAAAPERMVLDEVQHAPNLLRAIKQAVDRDRSPGRFLLTGSADVLLLPQIGEALTGRVEILTLWPLSQGEMAGVTEGFVDAVFEEEFPRRTSFTTSRSDIANRVTLGGFPEVVRRGTPERREAWFDAYVALLVQRDIRDLANIEYATAIPRLLRLLATRTSGLLNNTNLATALQLPQTTLKRYLAYLETLFLYQPVPPWMVNLGKRLVKSPKAALVDSGLTAYLLGLDPERVTEDPATLGSLLESFVVGELRKQSAWSRCRPTVGHFRTHNQQEVDIVLENRAGRVVGIEVKAAHTVTARDFSGLSLLQSALDERFVQGVLLYLGEEAIPFGPRLWAVPISALWEVQARPDSR